MLHRRCFLRPFHHLAHRRESAAAQSAPHPHDHLRLFHILSQFLAGIVDGEQGADVGRDRIEAAAGHQDDPLLLGFLVIVVDDYANPRRLAGDVDIVGAVLQASADDRRAETPEWSCGVDNHARASYDAVQRVLVLDIAD